MINTWLLQIYSRNNPSQSDRLSDRLALVHSLDGNHFFRHNPRSLFSRVCYSPKWIAARRSGNDTE